MKILPHVLRWLAKFLPERVITRGGGDGRTYLRRWYLCGDPGGLKYFPCGVEGMRWWQHALKWLPCVYLHCFEASDEDPCPHNHPWEAKSLILWGGYLEIRKDEATRVYTPGDVNTITENTFHRVLLLEDECWSLIKIGRKVQSWGFYDLRTREFVPWRVHRDRQARKAAKEAN